MNKKILNQTTLNQQELDRVESETLEQYDRTAESFWENTKNHDVSQNIEAFLNAMPKDKSLDILDFGCGPGRDVLQFKTLGHKPVGLDGSPVFCRMARQYTGCRVLQQNFSELDLEPGAFDGIFANASLFHIPSQALPKALLKLQASLRDGGILFLSIPRGNNEGWQGERYGHYMELEVITSYLEQSGFKALHHYYRPSGLPVEQQHWLAVISMKQKSKRKANTPHAN